MVRNPPQQKLGAGIKKFVTEVQEDEVGQQSTEHEKSKQRVAYTSIHRDI